MQNQNFDLFAAVKGAVTARQAAQLYGFVPDRRGMLCCPFHADKHPSMKLDERFHCFGCGADGDAIDFVARLFGLRPIEAARKLAGDAGVALSVTPDGVPPLPKGEARRYGEASAKGVAGRDGQALGSPFGGAGERSETERARPLTERARAKRDDGEVLEPLGQYLDRMRRWRVEYAPRTPEEPLHPRFCEALHVLPYAEQLSAELARMSPAQRRAWRLSHREEAERFGE